MHKRLLPALPLCLLMTPAKAAIDVVEASITDLQAAMQAGRLTSKELTRRYLERIKAVDKAGPRVNSVIAVNPPALPIPPALDQERRQEGPRRPLPGIPVPPKGLLPT